MRAMRPYRLAVATTFLLLLLSAAVVAYWFWATQALEVGIAEWRAEQIERGYDITYQGPTFEGFPFALSVSFREPKVVTPQGLTWQGPPVYGEAKLWDPFTIDLHFPGLHRLRKTEDDPENLADISAEQADGRVVLQSDGKVESARIVLGGLQVSGTATENVTLQRLTARLGPLRKSDGESLDELDLAGEALQVDLPPGRGGLLGDSLARISFDSTLVGGIPKGKPAEALPVWRDNGGRVRFHHLTALWGPLNLLAEGRLELDDAMRPAGLFETKMKGIGEIIDKLIETGKIKPEAAFAAKLAIAAMGRRDSATGESVLQAPVSLREGYLYLGPLPLLPVPPVL